MTDAKPKKTFRGNTGSGKSGGDHRGKPFGDITFITVHLSDAQKSACDHWINSGDHFRQALAGILASEYKVGFAYDQRNGAYIVSITDRREDSPFFAHCYSLRADEPERAFLRVAWVHSVFAEGDWNVLASAATDKNNW